MRSECIIIIRMNDIEPLVPLSYAGPTYLVFEDAEHASLLNYLQQNSKKNTNSCAGTECTLTNVEKLRIALDVVKGMRHLAQRKVSWG